jgi:hypothetical protein
MTALITALMLFAHPAVHPWPIGPGPRYLPPARTAAVAAGRPVGELRCGRVAHSFRLHLELFAGRRVIVVPAGIGVPLRAGRCAYPVRTLAPGGLVEVTRGTRLTLADLFRVWGQPLGSHRLASFVSSRPLRVYVGGRLVRRPAGSIVLTPHAEIVLELGPYVVPHSFFLFAGGDS